MSEQNTQDTNDVEKAKPETEDVEIREYPAVVSADVNYTLWEKIKWELKKIIWFKYIEPFITKMRNRFTDGGFSKSSMYNHMVRELELIGYDLKDINKDDINSFAMKAILEIGETFYKQGHSGFSANYIIGITQKLLSYETLAPLQGNADEWQEVGSNTLQNIRNGNVFTDLEHNVVYYSEAYAFRMADGGCFCGFYSRKEIKEFPYAVPKTEIIDADADENVPEAFKEKWHLENPKLAAMAEAKYKVTTPEEGGATE